MGAFPKREIKLIITGEDARQKIVNGTRKMFEAVSTTYGASGYNVSLGMPYGDAVLTRDGVTVAKRTILPDRAEDDAAAVLRQASEKTNRTTGDGTTGTIVLGYFLHDGGYKRIAAGENGMKLRKLLADDAKTVVAFLKEQSSDAAEHLLDVATVSAGDPAVGALVADTLKDIGTSGGITIREKSYPTIDVEKINGYYFDKGFFALSGAIDLPDPLIFVTQKQLVSNADIIPILSKVIDGQNKNLVIVGDVRMNSDAMNTLFLNVQQEKLNAVVIPPHAFNDEGKPFQEDVAIYVGAKLFMNGENPELIKTDEAYWGGAERVQVTPDKAIIFSGNGEPQAIVNRAAEINEMIQKETGSHRKDGLEQRFSKLTGKIAIVNVGGSTPTEMEELRYRVEDAIEATRSAMADGVLPGGGTMLVKAAALDISPLFKEALRNTVRTLFNNAGEPADYRIKQIEKAKKGFGFNLREPSEEPIDLREAGIFDATRSAVQIVENAASAAGSLLTTGTLIIPIDQEDSNENA